MDGQPKTPDDPELKNIIDKLANFVARNGPEFEKMTKHKQMNNPKFNFLYGGEYFNYYQCKVATEQQIIRHRKEKVAQQQAIIQEVITQKAIQTAPWQQQAQQQQQHLPMPPQLPGPQMQQPPPQMAPPPWQQPQPQPQPQALPPLPHPPQQLPGPHHPSLQQQQQQLQMQQQHLQQQIQVEKEKQELLLKERQEKERLEQEQQLVQREREQLQAQIKESEENLQKQHEVYLLQQQEQIELGIASAQDQQLQNLAKELEVDIGEFDNRLQVIIESCTKDAISNGKLWIFSTSKSKRHCLLVTRYLLHKIIPEGTPFEAKLHLIYLINDVTHHCMRRGAEELQLALGQVVGPIFCSTYLLADEGKKQKLEKVLKLWETNKYFDESVMTALKSPKSSMSAFLAGQLEEFSEVVSHVRESIAEQLSRLQKQHDEFVEHVEGMIQTLDARLEKLASEEQKELEARQESDEQRPEDNDVPTSMPPANIPIMGAGGVPGMMPGAPGSLPPGPGLPPVTGMPPVPIDPSAMATMFPNFDPSVPPPGFGGMPRVPFQPGMPPPNFPPPQPGMPPPPMHMMHPPNHPRGPMPPMPDFSKPPPGFGDFPQEFPPDFQPNIPPPDMEIMPLDPNDPSLMPTVPYYDLPAGLMAPLVKLEDTEYEPLDPEDIRLPPPQPPSKRLLAAVEAFYAPPSREAPRNSEGWEQNGLFEFFKAKQKYSKLKKERLERDGLPSKVHVPSPIRRDSSSSRSPSPQKEEEMQKSRRRYRSRSRSRSRSKSPVRRRRSVSRSRSRSMSPPYRRRSDSRSPPPRRRNRSPDGSHDRSRDRSRSRSRSRTPPRRRRDRSRSPSPDFGIQPFYQTNTNTRLGDENKGALLMKKMGWGGQGLGAREQGIVDPVSGGEVRDKMDMYRGVGVEMNDPFESFRKNKSSSFMTRMKARAAKSAK